MCAQVGPTLSPFTLFVMRACRTCPEQRLDQRIAEKRELRARLEAFLATEGDKVGDGTQVGAEVGDKVLGGLAGGVAGLGHGWDRTWLRASLETQGRQWRHGVQGGPLAVPLGCTAWDMGKREQPAGGGP